MPRERQFAEDQVREQLADTFAVHGYGGTSMALLQQATGLGKQSLYNTFGDKAAMYREAVDCATQRFARAAVAQQAAPSGRQALQAFFDTLLADCHGDDAARQRCIVSGGLLESLQEPALQLMLEQKWLATHELLRAAIERGQHDGSVASRQPSALLADQLMLLASGLRVMARVGPAAARLRPALQQALALLDT